MTQYDVIIIGGGTMGTAAAWECGKRGLKTLVLEQFQHIHTHGAHGGETRVIRHAYAEGPDYVPLIFRADDLWMDLEAVSGEKIFHRVGALEMSAPGNDHARLARESAVHHDIPFDWLSPIDVRRRFPQFKIQEDWVAGFGARGGFLDVERALRAMADQARAAGVEIRDNTPVLEWKVTNGSVTVDIQGERLLADRLIVTAGAWSEPVLLLADLSLKILRKTLFWLEVEDPSRYVPETTPVFIAGIPGYEFYGFPQWGRPGVKVADHRGGVETNPDQVNREVSQVEKDEIVSVANSVLEGITGNVLHATTCLYARTPDENFVIDRAPDSDRIVFGAGFSGHGFKFTPAIGELLVQVLFGERDTFPIFRLDRFES